MTLEQLDKLTDVLNEANRLHKATMQLEVAARELQIKGCEFECKTNMGIPTMTVGSVQLSIVETRQVMAAIADELDRQRKGLLARIEQIKL